MVGRSAKISTGAQGATSGGGAQSSDELAPPYPADTLAKGWRLELDVDRLMRSDTWSLAKPDVKPWLLMMWTVAWQQQPCGSMPADEEVIIARLGITPQAFEKARKVLMRDWWLASDGRLYHDTITARVLDMLGRKQSEAQRKRDYRDRKQAEARLAAVGQPDGAAGDPGSGWRPQDGPGGVEMSHGTNTGQTPESSRKDDTGTGTGTGLGIGKPPSVREGGEKNLESGPGPGSGPDALAAALRVCRAMASAGIVDARPGNHTLAMLLRSGAEDAEFTAAAVDALKHRKGFAYALGIVVNERKRAAEVAREVYRGALPTAPPVDPDSRVAVEADGMRFGLGKWEQTDSTGRTVPWAEYLGRVRKARERNAVGAA